MESGYQQEPVGGGRVRFVVRPAPAPRASGLAMTLAALFGLLVAGTTPAHAGPGEILARIAVAGGVGWWLHRRTMRWLADRLDRRRSPGGTFVVSPFGIEAAEARIEREHLERLIVRNAMPTKPAAAVSYQLCAESAGRATVLAGGMTESTALGLLTDVSRILSVGMAAARDRVGAAAGSV